MHYDKAIYLGEKNRMMFDSVVIGKGLIGSAATRYLSQYQKKIAVVGPDEPGDPNTALVFSSHYDQARVQRIIGTDTIWTLLNLQSANEYPFLQKETNINFHSGTGCLYVNPAGKDIYLDQIQSQGDKFSLKYRRFENAGAIHNSFPEFNFTGSSEAICEGSPSGYINPRLLAKAQLELSKKNGAEIITDIATGLDYKKNHIQIRTLRGDLYEARKVLLCPGAFINSLNLTEYKLAVTLKSETTILAKVSEQEAHRLSNLPSLLYEIQIPEYQNIYLIRPVKYADGNYYLKMGCNLPEDIYFDNLADIQHWFKLGDSDGNLKKLRDALMTIMPKLEAESFLTKRCIVSYTRHRKPYIGALNDDGLFVAAGGNGYAAMCSDAIGRIACHFMIKNIFPEEYSAETFLPVLM